MDRIFTPTGALAGPVEIRHFHQCGGLGGGAKGFNLARAQVGSLHAKFRCIGGFDHDPAACRDFKRLTGVPLTCLDLFSHDQYRDFYGHEPPADWREATPDDIHRAAGYEHPHIVFSSMPCKGFSGLLSESRSLSPKYQALNALALRGMYLCLEAFKDDPVEFYLFENVPRIQVRGRHLLDQIEQLLGHYGYASAETTHDCGEIGHLAQSRKRFLLVARHVEKVPPYLFEPVKRPLRAVGQVLDRCPLPGDLRVGPMHRVPALNWKTWVRLAFVKAGEDWRSLGRLAVQDGMLRDFAIERGFPGNFGVWGWEQSMGAVTGEGLPSNGAFSVADPRFDQSVKWHDGQAYGVRRWDQPSATVPGQTTPGQGPYCVADPRYDNGWTSNQFGVVPWIDSASTLTGQRSPGQGRFAVADPRPTRDLPFRNVFRIVSWNEVGRAVTGGGHPTSGGIGVADPRIARYAPSRAAASPSLDTSSPQSSLPLLPIADPSPPDTTRGKYRVTSYEEPCGTVIAGSTTGEGAFAVADPRPGLDRHRGDAYLTAGHYGVVDWRGPSGAVTAKGNYDNGPGSIADPRCEHAADAESRSEVALPKPNDRLVCIIRAEDGTWHRPFTTYELAVLQSLIDPEEQLELDGLSDSAWRERIGNAVPSSAAREIAGVIGTTLLLAWTGETFVLGSTDIWVRPIAVALTVARAPSPDQLPPLSDLIAPFWH